MHTSPPAFRSTLLRAFLMCISAVALTFALIALGIWVYSTSVLERENALVTRLLPELDAAYRLTAATSGLQSQGVLLRSTQTIAELESHSELLRMTISRMQQFINELDTAEKSLRIGVAESIGELADVVRRLSDARQQQIVSRLHQNKEMLILLDRLSALESDMRQQVDRLTEELLDYGEQLAQLSVQENVDAVKLHRFESNIADGESINLAIQDYLLFIQDLVSLGALVRRVPLLTDSEDVTVAEHSRDLLLNALVSRGIYMENADTAKVLLSTVGNIRSRMVTQQSVFAVQKSILKQEDTQNSLGKLLGEQSDILLAQTEQLRNDTITIVSEQAQQTLQGLERYRMVLLFISALVLLGLAATSYWLLYRKTVLPLIAITRQLDDVGTERFPKQTQDYFLAELSTLSSAMRQLDTVQKSTLAQEARLQTINEDLKRANEELEQFAHVASHDLQEPLRKLQQFSDLMVEDYNDKLDDDGRFFLRTIRTSAQRMSTLITETLAYSRAGSKNQLLEAVDLSQLVLQLREEMDLAIQEAQADLEIKPLPVVNANGLGMAQLFRNLLHNALKYRKPDTPARITISAVLSSNDSSPSLCIHVTDNGIGINEKHLQRVFLPFERMHSGVVQGTGLGLAICRKVCDSHNWTLNVKSTLGVGTTFEVAIPMHSVLS